MSRPSDAQWPTRDVHCKIRKGPRDALTWVLLDCLRVHRQPSHAGRIARMVPLALGLHLLPR